MGLRHDAREWALQFLFQSEFNQDASLDKAFQLFWQFQDEWAAASPSEAAASAADPADTSAHAAKGRAKARRFAEELARGVIAHHKEIDPLIEKYAANWEIDRMGIVDRNVMRIAVYEMLHRDDIPPVVSINEAVDLAKAFSSVESGKFVNGILDRIRMGLDRPARDAIDERKIASTSPAEPSSAPARAPEPSQAEPAP
ncbi:MAG: transcription antitermination factor NusB [Kiritimatiellae bacterium]|nr:transcription antitermination factor NusB [Kiritimatiellia bacterium]